MVKKDLLKELENGRSSFKAYGTVKVDSETFGEPQTSKHSSYNYSRAAFPIKTGEGRSTYVQMMGGYFPDKPVLKRFNKDTKEMFDIQWADRKTPQIIEKVAVSGLISIRLEHETEVVKDKDGNETTKQGKLITKQFISEIDAIKYLGEHLHNGEHVYIGGTVDYQLYNGEVQRQFSINRISLLEDFEPYTDEDGKLHKPHADGAFMTQSYLVDNSSVSKRYKSELEKNGSTTIDAWVPQYISKIDGEEVKAVRALPQKFVIEADTKDEKDIHTKEMLVEKYIKVKDRDVVRQIDLENIIADGFETSKGKVERTPEIQDLIDLGIMAEEEVDEQLTVTGNAVKKIVYGKPALNKQDGQFRWDKYDTSVLTAVEKDDKDDVKPDPFGNEVDEVEESPADVFKEDTADEPVKEEAVDTKDEQDDSSDTPESLQSFFDDLG